VAIKQKARAIDMFQAKELAREKDCKQERSEHSAAERQYHAVTKQGARRLSGPSAMLLPTTARF
jgi:hypothetical protein